MLAVVGSVVALLTLIIVWPRRIDDFAEQFPPISDDEFLACLRPGTDPAVALTVRRLVARHFAIEYARVHPSMSFVNDIGAD